MPILNLDEIPTSGAKHQPGPRVLKCTEAKEVVSQTKGSRMIQFSWESCDADKVKINYDNCPYLTADNQPISFGLNKLKKYIDAMGIQLPKNNAGKTTLDTSIIPALVLGKKIMVNCVQNEKGYLTIDSDLSTIAPVPVSGNTQNITPNDFMNTTDNDTTIDPSEWDL